jgi:hypothetical protein
MTNICTVKYDVMYIDIRCIMESMNCGSPVKISLNSVNTFVCEFTGFYPRPLKENFWETQRYEPPSLSTYLASDFIIA